MVFFNWATMQMAAKIVYYGPGLCGKTTNLSYIYAKTSPNCRGEMVSLETESDRTLFFDLLPIEVGTIGGFKTRMQLYTVPGQVFYNTTRKLVLKGVDGVVFVADSQRPMREANIESFKNLKANLAELDISLDDMPLVIQYNKRDLKQILTMEELDADFNPDGTQVTFEASAINGDGVFETLKEITKLTLKKLKHRMAAPDDAAPAPQPRPSAPPTTLSVSAAQAQGESHGAGQSAGQRPVQPRQGDAERSRQPASISAAALAAAAEEAVDESGYQPEEEPQADAVAAAEDAVQEHAPDSVEAAAEPPESSAPQVEPAADESEPFAVEEPAAAAQPEASAEATPVEPAPPEPEHDAEPVEPDARAEAEPARIGAIEPDAARTEQAEDRAQAPAEDATQPPPVKRVQVSSQVDILGELDNLRKQATMTPQEPRSAGHTKRQQAGTSLDLDSLLGGPPTTKKELRHKVAKGLNSDVFEKMHKVQIAMRLQDKAGETIHILEPVQMKVGDAGQLQQLMLYLTVDLENNS